MSAKFLKLYFDKFGNDNKDLSMASEPICSTEIRHSPPFLGVGGRPSRFRFERLRRHTTFATMNSIDKFVDDGVSILFLFQSIEVEPDRGGVENLDSVP
jgi:hypothetical protein